MRIAGFSPKSSLLRCPILLHLPCSLFCALTARRWLVASDVPYIPTLWQTSLKRSAVISQSSLWRIDGYPPRGQFMQCVINCEFLSTNAMRILVPCQGKSKVARDVLGPKLASEVISQHQIQKIFLGVHAPRLPLASAYTFQMSTPPPLLGQCPCRCMYIVLSLSIEIHNLYTSITLPSVHLQCREGASSKNVLTNVMAAIIKHKVYG